MRLQADQGTGEIRDNEIRYLLIRPDVLMGVARELDSVSTSTFVAALAASAFRNAQESFSHYQAIQRFATRDFLEGTFEVAAALGWGRWSLVEDDGSMQMVEVVNSPFAAGFGRSQVPVCGTIAGVLRACMLVGQGTRAAVEEVACVAQGAATCRFQLTSGDK